MRVEDLTTFTGASVGFWEFLYLSNTLTVEIRRLDISRIGIDELRSCSPVRTVVIVYSLKPAQIDLFLGKSSFSCFRDAT